MQMLQVNIGYDPGQDRLLLRISTSADLEYRLWFTRRMLRGIWPGLMQLVTASPLVKQQAAPEARQAVVEFQRAQALQKAEFGTEYQAPSQTATPGGEPILVHGVRMRPLGDGTHEIQLAPIDGPGVSLKLTEAMLHALVKLLQDGVKATDWDISLELPRAANASVAPERKLN